MTLLGGAILHGVGKIILHRWRILGRVGALLGEAASYEGWSHQLAYGRFKRREMRGSFLALYLWLLF